jgi:hypothetical protein
MATGRKILKTHFLPKEPATPPGEIVLREWEPGVWATQFHNLEVGGYGFGHYFNSLEEAEKDFEERIKNWGFKPQNDN